MSFQLFCVCLRPSFPRNTTAYRTIPLPSHLFSHPEPPMQFAFFITNRRKAPEKRASPFPSSTRRSDGRISKIADYCEPESGQFGDAWSISRGSRTNRNGNHRQAKRPQAFFEADLVPLKEARRRRCKRSPAIAPAGWSR